MAENFKVEKFDRNMAPGDSAKTEFRWHSADETPFRLSGFAFRTPGGPFHRMPDAPAGTYSPGVTGLARHTSGGELAFRTDSTRLAVRVRLADTARMYHMALSGCAGFDFYLGAPGKERFIGLPRFSAAAEAYELELLSFPLDPGVMREWKVFFPLYGGIAEFALGLDPDAKIEAPPPWRDPRPVVVYGTSVTQGGCATRPGMSPTNILSRRWNVPVLNFGFSGSGKGEPEVIEALLRVENPRLFILDYIGNAGFEGYRKTIGPALDTIRAKHPAVPIALATSLCRNSALLLPECRDRAREFAAANAYIHDLASARRADGDPAIRVLESGLYSRFPDWDECTVDGTHFTDLGFSRLAELWDAQLKDILVPGGEGKTS